LINSQVLKQIEIRMESKSTGRLKECKNLVLFKVVCNSYWVNGQGNERLSLYVVNRAPVLTVRAMLVTQGLGFENHEALHLRIICLALAAQKNGEE
jgi:hypothetical protein